MNESNKKVSLLTKLDNIDSTNPNNEIVEYTFHSAYLLMLNCIKFNVKDDIVKVILHLDEFIVELYSKEDKFKSFSIPYDFLDSFYIFLEDDTNDNKEKDNES